MGKKSPLDVVETALGIASEALSLFSDNIIVAVSLVLVLVVVGYRKLVSRPLLDQGLTLWPKTGIHLAAISVAIMVATALLASAYSKPSVPIGPLSKPEEFFLQARGSGLKAFSLKNLVIWPGNCAPTQGGASTSTVTCSLAVASEKGNLQIGLGGQTAIHVDNGAKYQASAAIIAGENHIFNGTESVAEHAAEEGVKVNIGIIFENLPRTPLFMQKLTLFWYHGGSLDPAGFAVVAIDRDSIDIIVE